MRGIRKVLFVMAALAAGFGFVACSNGDDDSSSGGGSSSSVVAVYKDENATTARFYGNGTFEAVMEIPDISYTEKEASGTYTGDPSQDGDITMTYEFIDGYESNKSWYDAAGIELNKAVSVKIENGKCEILGNVYTRQD